MYSIHFNCVRVHNWVKLLRPFKFNNIIARNECTAVIMH